MIFFFLVFPLFYLVPHAPDKSEKSDLQEKLIYSPLTSFVCLYIHYWAGHDYLRNIYLKAGLVLCVDGIFVLFFYELFWKSQ
jgi:hypothetical protein